MSPHAQTIQALLFATAEQFTVPKLSVLLEITEAEVQSALENLSEQLSGHGIMLLQDEKHITLVTRPEQSAVLETVRKEELSKDLSKASAETLSIILYKNNASKAEIELIRGVNATYSIRNLQMRGLIEAKGVGRAITYHPTLELLQHFGIESIEQLPAFTETRQKIETLLNLNPNE